VGKTTLARLLQPRFEANLLLEAFDENPFLSDFYGDRARYAFQTQIFFLLSRYRQQQEVSARLRDGPLLSDYFFLKDRLFARLNIDGDELMVYEHLYETLAENVTRPDLVIYLRAETDTLMGRIAMRDRPYERQMDRAYIQALRHGYEEIFATYEETPLLVIETDELDFVRRPEDLAGLESRVRAALSGIRQPPLPTLQREAPPRFNWTLTPGTAEPRSEVNWQVLGDFLALTTAVGNVGGALTQHPPTGPSGSPAELETALRRASEALNALARRAGVKLTQ
jgi:deoxyguanosine kinase